MAKIKTLDLPDYVNPANDIEKPEIKIEQPKEIKPTNSRPVDESITQNPFKGMNEIDAAEKIAENGGVGMAQHKPEDIKEPETMTDNLSPEFVDALSEAQRGMDKHNANNAKDLNKEEKPLTWKDRIRNGIATDIDIKDAYDAYKKGEYTPGPETLKEFEKLEKHSWDDAGDLTDDKVKELYDTYRAPKNGAEYLKRLWNSEQKGGKALAIANVLGNILGAVGGGKEYVSDWQKYRDNYIKAEQERNQREYNDAMDIVKQAKTNEQSRKDMLKQIDLAIERGANLSADEMAAIKNFSLGTGQSSYKDVIMAQIFMKLAPYIDDVVDLGGKAAGKIKAAIPNGGKND